MSTPPNTPPPNEVKLRLFLQNGPDYVDIVQRLIDQHKLPYIIVDGQLQNTKHAGQLSLDRFITTPDAMAAPTGPTSVVL